MISRLVAAVSGIGIASWTWFIYEWGSRWLWVVDTPDDAGAELAAQAGYLVAAGVWLGGLALAVAVAVVLRRAAGR